MKASVVTTAVLAGLTLFASQAMADMQVRLYNGPGSSAGEFAVDSVGDPEVPFEADYTIGNHDFVTFCVERTGYISYRNTYDVVLSDSVVTNAPGVSPDPIDSMTAYLFTEFATGELSDYRYNGTSGDHQADANELQEVLWYIEGEVNAINGKAQDWYNEAQTAVAAGGDWFALWGADSIGNVRVMNLYAAGHSGDLAFNAQDQLVLTVEQVPAPAAALLGMIGCGMVSAYRRKKA